MASEQLGADKFLVSTLTGDATIASYVGARVWMDVAPQVDPATGVATLYPIVLISLVSAQDVLAMGGVRGMSRLCYRVAAVGEGGGISDIQPIADRIDAIIGSVRNGVAVVAGSTYNILGVVRDRPWQRTGVDEGLVYNQLGGEYRLLVQGPPNTP